MQWYVYILACNNGSFYVGHAHDLSARFKRHRSGTGATHTATNAPLTILYQESFPTELDAVHRERQLKRWSRAKKRALIEGKKDQLHELSKSHDHAE